MASCSADINKDSRWYFTNEQLRNSPSKSSGIDAEKELDHRQQAAHLIQEMGQRLRVYAKKTYFIIYLSKYIIITISTKFYEVGRMAKCMACCGVAGAVCVCAV